MRRRHQWFAGAALAALTALASCGGVHSKPAVSASSGDEADPGAQRITAPSLAAYIRLLADDALEGRGPGTRGDRLTRLFIASIMQTLGLQPGGADGVWEQPFDLLGVTTLAPRYWEFDHAGQHLRFAARRDFVAVSGGTAQRTSVEAAEVVFAGYGIQAPEYAWDDFKGVDVRGKVLLLLNDDPDWDEQLFAGKRRLYYGRWTYKYESAARQGAAGAIIIHTSESAGYPWQTVVTSWTGENSRLPEQTGPVLALQAWMTDAAARQLVTLASRNLDDLVTAARARDFAPIPLGVTTSITLHTRVQRSQTANVLGLLPGSDPALQNQVVVYTAHHDHLGVKADASGAPVIYNGAVDNATGVAQLLNVAAAFTALPAAPRRSVLFLAVGAEEQGLLGSEYYAQHPTFPPGRIVADLNFDGGNIWGRTRDVVAIGFGKSSLDEMCRAAAVSQGRVYEDERFPERGSFYRSDQFSFAKIGVPAVLVHSGTDFIGRPPEWGREQTEAWIAQHYHQPSDDFDPTWNLEGMVEDAQLAFSVGTALANSTELPRWVPGDEFEVVRQRSLAELPGQP